MVATLFETYGSMVFMLNFRNGHLKEKYCMQISVAQFRQNRIQLKASNGNVFKPLPFELTTRYKSLIFISETATIPFSVPILTIFLVRRFYLIMIGR